MRTTTPTPPPFIYPQQAFLVHRDDVDRTERSREDYGNLAELVESFLSTGLIHPPLVTQVSEGKYKLVAGGRRTGAMMLMELEWWPVISYENLTEEQIIRMEGEENFKRLDMNWKERVCLIARRHDIQLAMADDKDYSWGTRETGRLLGVSSASVSHATQVRRYLLNGDPEITEANSLRNAYDILLSRRERQATALAAGVVGMTSERMTAATVGVIGDIDVESMLGFSQGDPLVGVMHLDEPSKRKARSTNTVEIEPQGMEPTVIAPLEIKDFPLSKLLFCGDSHKLMPQFAAESIDHIVTDIPYGIEMENLDTIKNLATMVETHDVEQNVSMMEPFLREAFRLLKPGGFCIFFYDLDHHEKLHAWAKQIGFGRQKWPIVWHKLHPCKNSASGKNWTKNAEYAMVLRKGNAVLAKPQPSCVFAADGSAERQLYGNPFAKPGLAWRFLLEPIAFKGQTILDPYAGEMSSVRAMIDLGLNFVGIELDKDRFYRGVQVVKNKLLEVTGGAATFS